MRAWRLFTQDWCRPPQITELAKSGKTMWKNISMRPYAHMHTCKWANAKKKTQKIGRKHRTPSEKEKNRNAKSVPTCIRFSPTRSKKSQPKEKAISYKQFLRVLPIQVGIVFTFSRGVASQTLHLSFLLATLFASSFDLLMFLYSILFCWYSSDTIVTSDSWSLSTRVKGSS